MVAVRGSGSAEPDPAAPVTSPCAPGSLEIVGERGAVRGSLARARTGAGASDESASARMGDARATPERMGMGTHWIGIDVAKTWLDVARSDREAVERYANTAAGI